MSILTLKDIKGKYLWEYEESLEESLGIISPYDININILCEDKDREKHYSNGDILMVPQWESSQNGKISSPHRIVVVSSVIKSSDGTITYKGRVMSSNIHISNKYNANFPNNIYIDDYDSILSTGRQTGGKSAFINVEDVITFTNNGLNDSGTWKGHISTAFENFLNACVQNCIQDKTKNKNTYWI